MTKTALATHEDPPPHVVDDVEQLIPLLGQSSFTQQLCHLIIFHADHLDRQRLAVVYPVEVATMVEFMMGQQLRTVAQWELFIDRLRTATKGPR